MLNLRGKSPMCTAHVQNKTNTWEKKGNISTCTNRFFFYNEIIEREVMKQIKKILRAQKQGHAVLRGMLFNVLFSASAVKYSCELSISTLVHDYKFQK